MQLEQHEIAIGKRYALILVDLSVGFTNPNRSPLASSADAVIAANQSLLAWFRQQGLPCFFTTVVYDSENQAAVFREKLPALNVLQRGSGLENIDPRLARQPHEPIIEKHWASSFFNTNLAEQLRALQVDGVVITGLTTSGCVRATAVDALQNDLRVIVPIEAVGDRDSEAHQANLRDLQLKYASVLTVAKTLHVLAESLANTSLLRGNHDAD